ncbi:hypothetical protein ACWD5A_33695, partial [Streptomyces sp. NPDC002491]
MSYPGPHSDPADPFGPSGSFGSFGSPQPSRSRLRRPLTVALTLLVPGALLGWLAYEALGASGGEGAGGGAAGAG